MKYVKYRLFLSEPVRIADDSSAKQGQTMTKCYIPGSTVRGYVINRLSLKPYFSDIKKELFSDHVRFHNAYLTAVKDEDGTDWDQVLLPSPKGFYEDKIESDGKKELTNVLVSGAFDEGMKRARLGTNVYIELPDKDNSDSAKDGTIHYFSPRLISDTKIKLGVEDEQKVFRNTSIMSGYHYTGFIALDNEDMPVEYKDAFAGDLPLTLASVVKETIDGWLILGNARTSGLGKCQVEYCELTDEVPFASYMIDGEEAISGSDDVKSFPSVSAGDGIRKSGGFGWKDCYMMLLSDVSMRDERGEYCGLNVDSLKRKLGVDDLEIQYCATAVNDARGFNRHYGGATPSLPMYEKGSVFHLRYRGILDKVHLDAVHRKGIGVRRYEGFGQVLFIRNYEAIKYKLKGSDKQCTGYLSVNDEDTAASNGAGRSFVRDTLISYNHAEDANVIKIAARVHYKNIIESAVLKYVVSQRPLPDTTSSQLGNILSIAMKNRYAPEEGWKRINAYFANKTKKEENQRVNSTKERKPSGVWIKEIKKIEDTSLPELLDLGTSEAGVQKVMGICVRDLFRDDELIYRDLKTDKDEALDTFEKRIKLELLIRLIRYNFKEEATE